MGEMLGCKLWARLVSCLCHGCDLSTAQVCSDLHACSPGGTQSTARQYYVMHRLFARLGFLPGFGLTRDSVTPSLPAPVRLRSRQGSRGVATLITLPSAELNVNHRPINDHGNSQGSDAAMRPEIGEVTA